VKRPPLWSDDRAVVAAAIAAFLENERQEVLWETELMQEMPDLDWPGHGYTIPGVGSAAPGRPMTPAELAEAVEATAIKQPKVKRGRGRPRKPEREKNPATRIMNGPTGEAGASQFEWFRAWLHKQYPAVARQYITQRALEAAVQNTGVSAETIKNYRNRARSSGKR
jgi:hypothetical protein